MPTRLFVSPLTTPLRAAVASVDDFLITWAAACALVFGLAAVIAGFGLLFFTRSERG